MNQEVITTEKSKYNYSISSDAMTPELFNYLYTSVGWEAPPLEQIAIALDNSLVKFTAFDKDEPVGMVRLIGDKGMSFYIKDFAVIPEYHGKGVGKLLMSAVESYIRSVVPEGMAVSLELISTKEAVAFYEKFGFEQRPCDWDGPGMFKMLR